MNIRIIAGKFGSLIMKTPRGYITHPMGERVKGALFNSLIDELPGAKVLDAFSGAGGLGLEALSRGASHVTFVDRDKSAIKMLKLNIDKLDCHDQTTVFRKGVSSWITSAEDEYDIIFADPPYGDMQLSTVEKLFPLLKIKGLMVLSYPGRGEAPAGTNGVVVVDNRSYGTAALAFYRRER